MRPYVIAWFCTVLAADMLISCHLVWFFVTRQTSFKDTDDLLKRLTKVTVGSVTAATLWTLGTTCTFVLVEGNAFLILLLSVPTLYLITLLFSLNSRYSAGHGGELIWTEESWKQGSRLSTSYM